jgi:nucleoside-diphosphate-sugar epimerase
MKVLVTGVAGLVGRWTAGALKNDGHDLFGLDVRPAQADSVCDEFFQCDLLDKRGVSRALQTSQPDAVIHLAARTDLNETRDLEGYSANIEGVRNLLEAISVTHSVRRSIITSSQLVCRIGHIPKSKAEYCPTTLYGESKVLTEKITKQLDGGGREWILTRPTTVWGPYMGLHYMRMLDLIQRGRYFHCGNGRLMKSYAFAGNIAWQYIQLLKAPTVQVHRKTFYLADYEPLSLRSYADALAVGLGARTIPTLPIGIARAVARCGDLVKIAGWRDFPFNSFRLQNILTEYVFDLRETQNVCGSLPFTWQEGVSATCRWYLTTR